MSLPGGLKEQPKYRGPSLKDSRPLGQLVGMGSTPEVVEIMLRVVEVIVAIVMEPLALEASGDGDKDNIDVG